MFDGQLITLYTDGKRVDDATDAREAAVFSIAACFDGNLALAAKLLPKATGDAVLGTLAVNMFFASSSEEEPIKEAVSRLLQRYPVQDTTVPRIDEPVRNNYLVGQSGSPLKYEPGEILPLDALIYKIAAMDAVARIGGISEIAESEGAIGAYEDLCNKLNIKFYDKKTGVFRAVKTEGGFSLFTNAVSLLPLYAGAVKDKRKIWSILRLFCDKNKFYLKNGVPIIPADSPYFGREFLDYNGVENQKFASFSGGIYPEFNLLTYFGLVRVGADNLASELALKNETIFRAEQERGAMPRFYIPDGKPNPKAEIPEKAPESILMALASRYDRCGAELFSKRKEMRFSTALWKSGESNAFFFNGERIRFAADGKNLVATRDGETLIRADLSSKGALVVRKLGKESMGLSFIADSPADGTSVTLSGKLFGGKGEITVKLPEGKSAVVVDFESGFSEVRRFNGRN